MSRIGRTLIVATCIALSACAAQQTQCPLPQTVTVTVTKYVPIDDSLVQPCPTYELPVVNGVVDRSVGTRALVAEQRRESLVNCNIDKAAIKLQRGTP